MNFQKIEKQDLKEAARVFSCAFFNDPLYQWFFKNEKTRLKKAKYFFEYELSVSQNFTYRIDGWTGLAVLQKPDDKSKRANAFLAVKLFFAVGIVSTIKAIRYLRFSEKVKKSCIHNDDVYLKLLCIDSVFRGQGLSRRIIESIEGDIYLETQNPNNVKIYEKLGFVLLEELNMNKYIKHFVLRREK